jgi:hypothetical protein
MKLSTHILTLAAAMFPVAAMCAEPPAVLQILRESLKEGRSAAHRKVESDWARTFRKAKFPYHYIALEAMTGAGNEVWFLEAYPSFAAIEESDKLIQSGALKSETEMLDARDGELRSNSRSLIAVYRKEMSYHPERSNLGKSRYMTVTTFRVKLGHEADFMAGSKLFQNAYEKINFPRGMAAYQVIGGAPAGMFLFVEPLEGLKAMDSMPETQKALSEAMGEEWGRLMKGAGDVFTSIENSFFRISPQMSYVSKETEDADPAFWRPKAPMAKPVGDAKPKEKPGA